MRLATIREKASERCSPSPFTAEVGSRRYSVRGRLGVPASGPPEYRSHGGLRPLSRRTPENRDEPPGFTEYPDRHCTKSGQVLVAQ
jgi:hypothetical protein